MHLCFWIGAAWSTASIASAQNQNVLPLPISSPTALDSASKIEPLTPKQKIQSAFRNTFGPRAIINRAILSGFDSWTDSPKEWPQGMEGYGMRMGNRMGRLAARNAVQLSADLAFKTDPRYDRCDCTSFLSRTKHAWKRVFVSRKDNGGEMISVSRLAGAYVTPIITDTWYPDRLNTWSHKMQSGTEFLLLRGATNMLREFWPEISRKLKIRRK
jgi:hypothetical protein